MRHKRKSFHKKFPCNAPDSIFNLMKLKESIEFKKCILLHSINNHKFKVEDSLWSKFHSKLFFRYSNIVIYDTDIQIQFIKSIITIIFETEF